MKRSLTIVLLVCLPAPLSASEKWADAKMPVSQPLLWLDGSAQKAAYEVHGKTLLNGSLVDVWYDASGQKRHVMQRVQSMQPRYVEARGVGFIRFGGKEFLGRIGHEPPLEGFTLFLVSIPRSNSGNFKAWFALSELGKNDYHTGLNVDMAAAATEKLSGINVEGAGFGKAVNLLKLPIPFGRIHTMRVEGDRGKEGMRLFVDGKRQGQRGRDKNRLSVDTITVGARYYSNTTDPPAVHGHFDGDIAEILLFGRVLNDAEIAAVEAYFKNKYATLERELASGRDPFGYLPKVVANPPPVQVLVPGFTVRELPVQLPNINNLRYRRDGKLVALGYNGNIYLLSDKDGDGLEETVHLFWENTTGIRGPLGIALTPPNYVHGQGVFVASKGKVSLIVDTDGDNRADKEIIVAQGWKEIAQTVDALGLALDKDGNIYFGLGTTNFANAYLKDKDGKAHFDIKSDRGTIQKVSADFKKRETFCTGVRFTVALAFNRHGDLFCTDQEGATWLPNGNPFDELLHLQPGRHYGFPPRHPVILPKVIDEPSVFDYGPQHQSTCGLAFNESVTGGPTFGPANWAGDAIVCGESRGKLYRTKLVKTQYGYVAQNHLFACLQMLTVDATISPKGNLVVCCHSGPPDWGTGPQGKGKLYQISYTDKEAPQPLFAYPSGPREVRIAFDKPLDPETLKNLTKQVQIEYGKYVRPGDRFETLQPPYAIVKNQLATPRRLLPVYSAQITADRGTIVLTTGLHTEPVHYAISLPRPTRRSGYGEMPQHATIDTGYDLSGIRADWAAANGERWSGWLPHSDLDVSRAFTAGSAEHASFWKMAENPGKLTVSSNLDLWNLLRPAVQLGGMLDYRLTREQINVFTDAHEKTSETTVRVEGSLLRPAFEVEPNTDWQGTWTTTFDKRADSFGVSYSTNEDDRRRVLPLHRHLVPWATRKPSSVTDRVKVEHPELKGGNWSRGKDIFFGETAQCGRCHQVRGQGGLQGPDLSNLIHRDYDSVLRDIKTPSAAINPDYLTYVVNLKDGRTLSGTLRSEGDKLWIGNSEGKEVAIVRTHIESLQAAAISTMPDGLDKKLSAADLRDLMRFLLTEPVVSAQK